jgi:hypothetical protein
VREMPVASLSATRARPSNGSRLASTTISGKYDERGGQAD